MHRFKLHPSKTPKAIDLVGFGQKRGPDGKLQQNPDTAPGIYDLDGNTLRLCLPSSEKIPRPTEFKAIEGKQSLLTLEREQQK